MTHLDWQQLVKQKCPRCKADLIEKSMLEPVWGCLCGFEITMEQYEKLISHWFSGSKKTTKPVAQVSCDVDTEPEDEGFDEDA